MFFSDRKLQANRENARKSTGPTTPEGKAKSALNRTKHGLTGSFRLLPTEDIEQFEELLNQYMIDEKPVGIAEIELVKTMVQHLWMSRRADCFQTACFMVQQDEDQAANNQAQIEVRPELERYLRYQAHHDRAYQRASNELLKRRKERLKGELGFESQKRAAAAEQRRENSEDRQIEQHKFHIATAEQKLEREIIKTERLKTRAAGQTSDPEGGRCEKVAA